MDMDMVRSWKDPWGRSTSLGPSEAWTVLTNLCGRSRPVGPMLALYANATVVLTLAAGIRCAWYGLTGPLDAEQSPRGPGT